MLQPKLLIILILNQLKKQLQVKFHLKNYELHHQLKKYKQYVFFLLENYHIDDNNNDANEYTTASKITYTSDSTQTLYVVSMPDPNPSAEDYLVGSYSLSVNLEPSGSSRQSQGWGSLFGSENDDSSTLKTSMMRDLMPRISVHGADHHMLNSSHDRDRSHRGYSFPLPFSQSSENGGYTSFLNARGKMHRDVAKGF